MVSLDPVGIEHVARIARLALTPEERARFAAEAQAILGHFESVEAALRDEAPATEPAGLAPREDEPRDPDPAQVEGIVAQFPRKDGRLAKVPEGL